MRTALDPPRPCNTYIEWAQEGERLCKSNKFVQGIECLETALRVGSDDLQTLSAIYCQLGNAYFALRNYDKAVEYHSSDMFVAKFSKDLNGEAKACGNIGNAFKIQGSFNDALIFTRRQLDLAEKIGDTQCKARALYNLASVYHMKGKQTGRLLQAAAGDLSLVSLSSDVSQPFRDDIHSAIQYYKETLKVSEELNDRISCGRTYGSLGNAYYLLRDFTQAIEYHYLRLEVAREFGDKSAQRRAYSNLGNAHLFLSQIDKAIEFYRLAISLSIELRERIAEAQSYFSLANAASLNSDFHTASEYHARHLSMARALKDRAGEARAYTSLANDYRHIGDLPKAAYFLTKHRHIAREMKDVVTIRQVEESLRELLAEGGDDLIIDGNEFRLDASADPDCAGDSSSPSPLRLSLSLRSLIGDYGDCGLTRHSAFHSDTDISARPSSRVPAGASSQEDFFDFLQRVQSKRMDEQRCDASILSDMTNVKAPRHTDTLTPSPSVSLLSNENNKRRQSLFGRVTSAVFKDMKPLSTSTPFAKKNSSSKSSHSSLLFMRTPSFARFGGSHRKQRSPSVLSVSSAASMPVGAEAAEPEFVVPLLPPVAPPRQKDRRHSVYGGPQPDAVKGGNGPDALIDLLMQAQGRRMDEQRASLLPGLQGGPQEIIDKLQTGSSELEGGINAVDERMLELLIRAQSQRMNEQRSELGGRQASEEAPLVHDKKERVQPSTIPEDDISALVLKMTVGRMEDQRAHLSVPDEAS